jgi:large subunit ribosomal protein L18
MIKLIARKRKINKYLRRIIRKIRVRSKIKGSAERPRLSVFRSNIHIYSQIIDDSSGRTLVSASSLEFRNEKLKGLEKAKKVGEMIAQRALEKGIKKVVFDRGPYKYHGRVKELAEAARKASLEF